MAYEGYTIQCYTPSGATVSFWWMPDADEIIKSMRDGDRVFLLRMSLIFYMVLRREEYDGGGELYMRIGSLHCPDETFREEFGKAAHITVITII